MVGLTTLRRMSANGLATRAEVVATTAMVAVVVITPAGGMALTICAGMGTSSTIRLHSVPSSLYPVTCFLPPSKMNPMGSLANCFAVGH